MTPPTPTPSLQVPTPTELEGFVCPSCDQPTKTGCLCSHCASFRRRDAGSLAARIKELEEALEPFAREGRKLVEQQDPYSWCGTGLSNANLRRAALTLNKDSTHG